MFIKLAGCADSKRGEKSTVDGWVGAPGEEGRIVSRSRGCIVPRIVCPIVWHHGPITADKARQCSNCGGVCAIASHVFARAQESGEYKKKNVTQMCSRRKEYRCRDGEGWTGNDSISSAFLYELMCRLYQTSRENWESKSQSKLVDIVLVYADGTISFILSIYYIYYFLWHLILPLIKIDFRFRSLAFAAMQPSKWHFHS